MSATSSRDEAEHTQALHESDSKYPRKDLPPEAQRALAEAAARRQATEPTGLAQKEINGPKGPEPTRYGDWETKGIASDF